MSKSATAMAPEKAPIATPVTPARRPLDLMRSFSQEMDRLFEDFGIGRHFPFLTRTAAPADALWAPDVDIEERNGQMIVRADLPGLSKDDIKVELADDALTIEGERKHTDEKKEGGYYRSECSYGHFYRSIALPDGARPDTAKASFVNGVLQVTIDVPARQTPASRRLTIEDTPKAP